MTLDQMIEKDNYRSLKSTNKNADELKEKINKLKERNNRFGDCETSNL